MSRFINVKNIITAVFVLHFLYCCCITFWRLGTEYSIDAAAGFLYGLFFAFGLYISIKCIGFLHKEVQEWWSERRAGRTSNGE